MATYEIPLTPEAQTMSIALGGVTYNLNIYWNIPGQNWMLDIADSSGNPILNGIALVAGVDLLGQFGYLNFGGTLYAQLINDWKTPPSYDNLGSTGKVLFTTP